MSDSDIQMTTKLDGENTRFLPFNQGNEGMPATRRARTRNTQSPCFWESICQRDARLRIFHSFVLRREKGCCGPERQLVEEGNPDLPALPPVESVNAMITMLAPMAPACSTWPTKVPVPARPAPFPTAHDLVKLRDNGEAIFNSVIIVTDRNVLDSQFQDAVRQIDHQFGVIAAIDRQSSKSKSKQLAEALMAGTPSSS